MLKVCFCISSPAEWPNLKFLSRLSNAAWCYPEQHSLCVQVLEQVERKYTIVATFPSKLTIEPIRADIRFLRELAFLRDLEKRKPSTGLPVRCWRGEDRSRFVVHAAHLLGSDPTFWRNVQQWMCSTFPQKVQDPPPKSRYSKTIALNRNKGPKTPLYIDIVIDAVCITSIFVDLNLEARGLTEAHTHHFFQIPSSRRSLLFGSSAHVLALDATTTATTGRNSLCGRPHGEADGTPRILTCNGIFFEATIRGPFYKPDTWNRHFFGRILLTWCYFRWNTHGKQPWNNQMRWLVDDFPFPFGYIFILFNRSFLRCILAFNRMCSGRFAMLPLCDGNSRAA